MRRPDFIIVVFLAILNLSAFAQNQNAPFKMVGQDPKFIQVDGTYSETTEINPFDKNINKIYGLAVSAEIKLLNENSKVEFILVDQEFNEYLIYETYSYLQDEALVKLDAVCEETSLLEGVKVKSVIIHIQDAEVNLAKLHYVTRAELAGNVNEARKALKREQNAEKAAKINKGIKARGQSWIAGPTSVAELSYSERKTLYGQSTFPAGFEFYAGGVISAGTESTSLKSASSSAYIDNWDWRNRHGKNWITSIKNQSTCGSCWAFAAIGATEANINLFFNQQLNLDLSEQELLSCSGAGDCSGGYPSIALDYITNTGVVDEAAFPYMKVEAPCESKSTSPTNKLKIGGKVRFGDIANPAEEDRLKKWIIETGPVSGGLYDWLHAMPIVGFKVVKEGDNFYYCGLDLVRKWLTVTANDPLIGKTVWIFKNSWGPYFGDQGYVYVETPISNIGWTYALKTPVTSLVNNYNVVCTDADGDGYYWWGLGPKPANCPPCPALADGNDSDPTLGPLDQYGYCMPLTPAVQPVANFTSSATSIYTGANVQFTDLSENTPSSWAWEFTGGTPSTSTAKNPLVTYNSTGSFQVKLSVTNAAGSASKTIVNYINVTTQPVVVVKPVADFTASLSTVEAGKSITFTDASSNTPTSWSWTFEGGSPSTSSVASQAVVYNTPGQYSVSLTASNSAGSATKTLTQFVTVTSPVVVPVADFVADNTLVNEGQSVNFSDKSANNPSSWKWVFEGGNPSTSTERNPKVSYNSANNYKVSLTVTNAAGNNTKTVENYINVQQLKPEYCVPSADASSQWISKVIVGSDSYSSGANGYANYSALKTFKLDAGTAIPVQLVPGFSGRSNFEYWVVWIDFNSDFSFTDDEIVFSPTKTKSTVSGSILIPANLQLTTRMRVAMGTTFPSACTNSLLGEVEDYTITISQPVPQPPVADFAANVYTVNKGESVQFADLSTNEPSSWQWSFPGSVEGSSILQNPVITYNTAGTYSVSLSVSKPGFASSTLTKNALITVKEVSVITYCQPVAINSSVNFISGVSIGTVFSNKTGGDKYSYSASGFGLVAGQSYNVELTPSQSSSRNFWRIWLDFNGDGDFDDVGETLLTINNSKGTVASAITIPASSNATARMRISMRTGKAPASCDDNFEGEVEDYEVALGVQNYSSQMASTIASAFDMEDEISISVYPNPTRDMLSIKLSELGSNDTYSMYSATGSKIMENRIDENISRIDMSGQPSGVYILVVDAAEKHFTEKIIKK